MNTFKKKSLYAALAGVSALGVTGAAQAVNVNPDGLGQVLLYPYYTTRADSAGNAYGTLLSVVNSTGSAKAVKVRFLEGKNSQEVLDFNLFLSPYDVWVAAILPDTTTGGARVATPDRSCTLPDKSFWTDLGGFVYAQSFVNFQYSGTNDDGAGQGLDRTKEGYFEIIEMATYSSSSTTGKAITHVNGVPPCGSNLNDAQASTDAQPLGGGLFGGETLINVASGTDYTSDPTALDNFFTVGNLYRPAGDVAPTLQDAQPPRSIVVANNNVYSSLWSGNAANSVSAVLMHNTVLNEFVLDPGTKSMTDWVVTMPTKRYYVHNGTGAADPPFQRNFNKTQGACDDMKLNIYDREERTTVIVSSFSPPPPPGATLALCWEANVVTFNALVTQPSVVSNILGSINAVSIGTSFPNGWLNMQFPAIPPAHQMVNTATNITAIGGGTTTGNTVTYVGLPVIGFALVSFTNGTLQVGTPPVTVLSNYGGNFKHKNNTDIH